MNFQREPPCTVFPSPLSEPDILQKTGVTFIWISNLNFSLFSSCSYYCCLSLLSTSSASCETKYFQLPHPTQLSFIIMLQCEVSSVQYVICSGIDNASITLVN